MQDQPPAPRLLEAIADLLGERVVPIVEDRALAHEVRVAASLCRILAREAEMDGEIDERQRTALARLVGERGDTAALEAELAERLADGAGIDADLLAALRVLVGGKLEVARPGYAG